MQKVEELKSKVAQETAAKDGLMKMKGVYEANPALGDPMTIEGTFIFYFYTFLNNKHFFNFIN